MHDIDRPRDLIIKKANGEKVTRHYKITFVPNYFRAHLIEDDWLAIARWDSWKQQTKLLEHGELTPLQASMFVVGIHPAITVDKKQWNAVIKLKNLIEEGIAWDKDVPKLASRRGHIVSKFAELNDQIRSAFDTEDFFFAFPSEAYYLFLNDLKIRDYGQAYIFDPKNGHGYFHATDAQPDDFVFEPQYLYKEEADTYERRQASEKYRVADEYKNREICAGVSYSDLEQLLSPESNSYLPRLEFLLQTAKQIQNIKDLKEYKRAIKRLDLDPELMRAGIGNRVSPDEDLRVDSESKAIKRMLLRERETQGGRPKTND